jgi:actin-like ATPase involved in cell morphogenesis
LQGERPAILADDHGDRAVPSVVARARSGDWLVGAPALRQAVANPNYTVVGVKRLLGRRFDAAEVAALRERAGFGIVEGDGGCAAVRLGDCTFRPAEVAARVLRYIKSVAEARLDAPVTEAVIAVPAHFDVAQRAATREAGELAHLRVAAIVDAPAAAAVGYARLRELAAATIAVFDLGGGTFDISIVKARAGDPEVLASRGDSVGGDDFDRLLVDVLIDHARAEHGVELAGDTAALQRLAEAAENAKCDLTAMSSTVVQLPFLAVGPAGPINLEHTIARSVLESKTGPLIARLRELCEAAFAQAGIAPGDVDHALVVGGATRVPTVQRMAARLFGQRLARDVNPDEIVALGAAVHAACFGDSTAESVERRIAKGSAARIRATDVPPVIVGGSSQRTTLRMPELARTPQPEPAPAQEHVGGAEEFFPPAITRTGAAPAGKQKNRTARSTAGYGFVSENARRISSAHAARVNPSSRRRTTRMAKADAPNRRARDPARILEAEVERARRSDAFAQLGLHWTDPPSLVDKALATMRSKYGPAGAAAKTSAELAAERLALAQQAYESLKTLAGRRAYRAEMKVDVKSAADLLDQQARLDVRRQDYANAVDKLQAAIDLEPTAQRRKILEGVTRQMRANRLRPDDQ